MTQKRQSTPNMGKNRDIGDLFPQTATGDGCVVTVRSLRIISTRLKKLYSKRHTKSKDLLILYS